VELFAKNTFLGHFGHFQPGKEQIIYSSNYSTQHLQNDNVFPMALHFTTFLLGHAQQSNFFGSECDLRF